VDHTQQSAQTMGVLGTHPQPGFVQAVQPASDAAGPTLSSGKAPGEEALPNVPEFSQENLYKGTQRREPKRMNIGGEMRSVLSE